MKASCLSVPGFDAYKFCFDQSNYVLATTTTTNYVLFPVEEGKKLTAVGWPQQLSSKLLRRIRKLFRFSFTAKATALLLVAVELDRSSSYYYQSHCKTSSTRIRTYGYRLLFFLNFFTDQMRRGIMVVWFLNKFCKCKIGKL